MSRSSCRHVPDGGWYSAAASPARLHSSCRAAATAACTDGVTARVGERRRGDEVTASTCALVSPRCHGVTDSSSTRSALCRASSAPGECVREAAALRAARADEWRVGGDSGVTPPCAAIGDTLCTEKGSCCTHGLVAASVRTGDRVVCTAAATGRVAAAAGVSARCGDALRRGDGTSGVDASSLPALSLASGDCVAAITAELALSLIRGVGDGSDDMPPRRHGMSIDSRPRSRRRRDRRRVDSVADTPETSSGAADAVSTRVCDLEDTRRSALNQSLAVAAPTARSTSVPCRHTRCPRSSTHHTTMSTHRTRH